MNKNHLVPQMIVDLVEKVEKSPSGFIESMTVGTYITRLEAIRDYCDAALKKAEKRRTKSN